MNMQTLARSYLEKAKKRLRVLEVLLEEEAYTDMAWEAQELVESAIKGMLRHLGMDPPKWHDVGPVLADQEHLFSEGVRAEIPRLRKISKRLRKEREFAIYGDIDFIPTEEHTRDDALEAIADARFVVATASRAMAEALKAPERSADESGVSAPAAESLHGLQLEWAL